MRCQLPESNEFAQASSLEGSQRGEESAMEKISTMAERIGRSRLAAERVQVRAGSDLLQGFNPFGMFHPLGSLLLLGTRS
mmetsp:Transcript_28981/g.46508  ORF Transcript_28981/g.46508 Transcript_28981/m.46508 type:complete len:80 (+) Transcript_28981:230-469(+)